MAKAPKSHPRNEKKLMLRVENFSCIEYSEISISPFTILVGPQASGKSLLSKLIYFFNSIVKDHTNNTELSDDIDVFKKLIREKFSEWFPPPTWGQKKFRLEYSQGPYEICISRSVYGGIVGDTTKVRLSKAATDFHADRTKIKRTVAEKIEQSEQAYDEVWRVREELLEQLHKKLGASYVSGQIFIPAGRSFFTSTGKMVTVFEHARLLDPVTVDFGKRLAFYLDRGGSAPFSSRKNGQSLLDIAAPLLGGKVIFNKNGHHIATPDGRTIPFGLLSSGQQELLPLLIILDGLSRNRPNGIRFLCIEEPEAHLFPTAQSAVIEYLASISQRINNNLLVTTHSPYVLSKVNNLIYAGMLSKKLPEAARDSLGKIINPSAWINPSSVTAYAVKDGIASSIIEADGMVSGDYLDDVSSTIANEFDELLKLEEIHGLV